MGYRYFKNSNLLLEIYASNSFPTDELKKVIEGISLSPATEVKDTSKTIQIFEEVESSEVDSDDSNYEYVPPKYFDVKQNTPFTIRGFDGTISVGNVNFFDSINDLDEKYFYLDFIHGDYSPVDKNGNMISSEYVLKSYGDGKNTLDKTLGTTKTKLQFVTAEVTLNNTTDYEQEYYPENIYLDIYSEEFSDKYGYNDFGYAGNLIYLKDDRELAFSDATIVEVPANSSKTITVGFISDELGSDYQQLEFIKDWNFVDQDEYEVTEAVLVSIKE